MIEVYDLIWINAISSLIMVGIIWMVQIVNYPLYAKIFREHFTFYHRSHMRRIAFVVGVPMIAEAISSGLLVYISPPYIPAVYIWLSFCLTLMVWLVTLFCSIPAHNQLQQSFDGDTHRFLVRTNWFRTLGWSMQAALSVTMLYFM